MIIIDATNQIIGRMATFAAKATLSGEQVHVVNCEKGVFTGDPRQTMERYLHYAKRGTWAKGPFITRRSDMMVKRIIRGMLPFHKEHGAHALKLLRCHVGVPAELAGKETKTFENASLAKLKILKYTTVGSVVKFMGGTQ